MKVLSGTAVAPALKERGIRADALASAWRCAMVLAFLVLLLVGCSGCGGVAQRSDEPPTVEAQTETFPQNEAAASSQSEVDALQGASDKPAVDDPEAAANATVQGPKPKGQASASGSDKPAHKDEGPDPDVLFEALDVTEDYRSSFVHGDKPAKYQRYIVLHDTEGGDSAQNVIDWWDSNGNLVAAHFIVNKDGSIWQCVPLDKIAHHAGYGDTGHNEAFDTPSDDRDDKKGSQPIGDWAADYAMNSYSVGIEMVHQGGEGDYPAAQLEAVDALIAYIDAYYGFESQIIDHKAWRSGNSDTSEEFSPYLKSYQQKRTHK